MKRYSKYKDSGVKWIREIPSHWNVNKLSWCLDFTTGFTPPNSNFEEYYVDGSHIWVNISDLDSKIVEDSKTYITDAAVEGREIVPQGSLLYSFKLSVGKMAFAGCDLYTNEAIFAIKPDSIIILEYYYYLLGVILKFNSNENIYGAKLLNQELIKSSKVLVPPGKEQQAIASFLDTKTSQIDHLIKLKQRKVELLKEKRTALINQVVTKGLNPDVEMKDTGVEWIGEIPRHWRLIRMKFLCDITTGDKDTKDKLDEGKYPFFVRSQKVENINTFTYNGEGILTAGDGVGVGKVFHHFEGKFDFHQRVYLMYNFRQVLGEFLFHYMKNNFIKTVENQNAKSTVDSLRLNMLQNFLICCPPIQEQNEILSYLKTELNEIDRLIVLEENKIKLLKEYRQSLISEVVTGKVRVYNQDLSVLDPKKQMA